MRERGLPVRRPDRTLATLDHSTPTAPADTLEQLQRVALPAAAAQVRAMIENCREFGVELRGLGSPERGIVHVVGPELGRHLARPHGCLRGQSYQHPRRFRRAGLRHRNH